MTSPPSLLLPPEFTISATDREGGVRIVYIVPNAVHFGLVHVRSPLKGASIYDVRTDDGADGGGVRKQIFQNCGQKFINLANIRGRG